MGAFSGSLNTNEIFSALYNMIISQQVFADNIGKKQTLVDKARVDGSLYGDTKLYYATDALKSAAWGNDSEASNLLALHRPDAPECQAITINQFRQIALTVDNYLTKRAWATEAAFSDFNSVMLGWIGATKDIYDGTLYNAFIGTNVSSETAQNIGLSLTSGKEAQEIAQKIADLMVEMGDYRRDFNDYKNLRSYAKDDIKIIWNAKYVNMVKYLDLPTIFHAERLEAHFTEDILPARYFGTVITATNVSTYSDSTPAAGKPIDSDNGQYTPGVNNANGCVRSLVEKTYTISTTVYHVFPGDELQAGATIGASSTNFLYGEVYIEDPKVICKVVVKLPPYMSAFSVATSFFNAKSLTENHYLTFGHNTLEHLKNYPFITIKQSN